jgi:hypothetical protein
MVPLRSAKMKEAALPLTGKEEVLLLTWPVGPCGLDAVVGMLTVRPSLLMPVGVTEYRVLVLVPWFETQKGLLALKETPHGLTRLKSWIWARPETSETRFVGGTGSGCSRARAAPPKARSAGEHAVATGPPPATAKYLPLDDAMHHDVEHEMLLCQ